MGRRSGRSAWRRTPKGRASARTAAVVIGLSALLGACATTVAGVPERPAGIVTSAQSTSGQPTPVSPMAPTPTAAGPTTDSAPSTDAPSTDESPTDESTTGSSETDPTTTTSTSGTGDPEFDPFPTEPTPYNKTPSTEGSAAALEARRMSEWVVLPIMVDKKFDRGGGLSTLPIRGPEALGILFSGDAVQAVAKRNGMIAGFSSAAAAEDDSDMVIAVFEFPNPASATKAATQLAKANEDATTKKVEIPGYPKAAGLTYTSETTRAVHAFLADGSQVAYVWTSEPAGRKTALGKVVATALKAQLAELTDFTPTPPDELMDQPIDPDGLLARTLPVAPDEGTVIDGNYSARGFLHFTLNPLRDQEVYAQAGVDTVARRGSTLYRAANAAGARLVVADFINQTNAYYPDMTDLQIPDGADSGACLEDALGARYYCVGQYGRYAVEIWEDSTADLEKAVAAQGTLLEGY